METITKKRLQSAVDLLNKIVDAPLEPYYWDEYGKFHRNKQTFSLHWANGTVRLVQGDSRDITPAGTKRETWHLVHAFIDGVEHAQRLAA